jgi:cytochrome c
MKPRSYAMKFPLAAAVLALAAAPAFAADVAKGEKDFKKCKSCHMIVSDAGDTIVKGGKTGPNLYGVIGRAAGAVDGFRYSSALTDLGAAGVVWDEASLAEYITDPNAYASAQGVSGRTKMSFKLKKGSEDVAAYLASLAQ